MPGASLWMPAVRSAIAIGCHGSRHRCGFRPGRSVIGSATRTTGVGRRARWSSSSAHAAGHEDAGAVSEDRGGALPTRGIGQVVAQSRGFVQQARNHGDPGWCWCRRCRAPGSPCTSWKWAMGRGCRRAHGLHATWHLQVVGLLLAWRRPEGVVAPRSSGGSAPAETV